MPDVGWAMLKARTLNRWLGTNYDLEAVEQMDPLLFEVLGAVMQGMEPTPGKREGKTDGNA
jgi:hypothetical protein